MTIGTTVIEWQAIDAPGKGMHRQAERQAVAQVLEAMLGTKADLMHKADGAPMLDGWHISISHSRDLAVVALDRQRTIGIDAEQWREALWRVRAKFLSEAEMAVFVAEAYLLKAWTAKEAVYKAAGIKHLSFAEGIAIASDFGYAEAAGKRYDLAYFEVGANTICLATQNL